MTLDGSALLAIVPFIVAVGVAYVAWRKAPSEAVKLTAEAGQISTSALSTVVQDLQDELARVRAQFAEERKLFQEEIRLLRQSNSEQAERLDRLEAALRANHPEDRPA